MSNSKCEIRGSFVTSGGDGDFVGLYEIAKYFYIVYVFILHNMIQTATESR